MKIYCIFDKYGEVPELINEYGYHRQTVLHLTKEKEYEVYGMISYTVGLSTRPSLHYLIRDDLNSIFAYNSMLFEVVDSCLPDVEWHFSFGKNGMEWILGYDEFVNNREHYESAIQGDEPGYGILKTWCDKIDRINIEKRASTTTQPDLLT